MSLFEFLYSSKLNITAEFLNLRFVLEPNVMLAALLYGTSQLCCCFIFWVVESKR